MIKNKIKISYKDSNKLFTKNRFKRSFSINSVFLLYKDFFFISPWYLTVDSKFLRRRYFKAVLLCYTKTIIKVVT